MSYFRENPPNTSAERPSDPKGSRIPPQGGSSTAPPRVPGARIGIDEAMERQVCQICVRRFLSLEPAVKTVQVRRAGFPKAGTPCFICLQCAAKIEGGELPKGGDGTEREVDGTPRAATRLTLEQGVAFDILMSMLRGRAGKISGMDIDNAVKWSMTAARILLGKEPAE